MTQDWRKIEAAIADFLDREGFTIDRFADTLAESECSSPICNGNGGSFNVTKLAQELADLK